VFFSDPKSDRCSSVVEARLLRCARVILKSVFSSCIDFHDEEWGVLVHDNNLSGVLSELSWKYILFKRQSFRVSQKIMNAHEAEAAAKQAVSQVEAAMTAAEEAAKEADAAEAA
ncbi:hypothetical protein HID58_037711, partial [Brassica napus]